MATLESAKNKYARKASNAANNYNAAKSRMKSNWARGMSDFLGAPVSGHRVTNYSNSIDAAQYRPGDPNKWAERLRAAMTGS